MRIRGAMTSAQRPAQRSSARPQLWTNSRTHNCKHSRTSDCMDTRMCVAPSPAQRLQTNQDAECDRAGVRLLRGRACAARDRGSGSARGRSVCRHSARVSRPSSVCGYSARLAGTSPSNKAPPPPPPPPPQPHYSGCPQSPGSGPIPKSHIDISQKFRRSHSRQSPERAQARGRKPCG